MEENELYHHGVKGQRWGVRRYQNTDGSLTIAGQKKAASLRRKYTKLTDEDPNNSYSRKGTNMKIKYKNLTGKNISRYPVSESSKKMQKVKSNKKEDQNKTMKDLSNEELRKKTERMRAEKDYLDAKMNLSSLNPKHESAGKKFVNDIGKKVIMPAVTEGSKRALQNYAQAWIQKQLGVKIKKDVGPEIVDEIKKEVSGVVNEAKQASKQAQSKNQTKK